MNRLHFRSGSEGKKEEKNGEFTGMTCDVCFGVIPFGVPPLKKDAIWNNSKEA